MVPVAELLSARWTLTPYRYEPIRLPFVALTADTGHDGSICGAKAAALG